MAVSRLLSQRFARYRTPTWWAPDSRPAMVEARAPQRESTPEPRVAAWPEAAPPLWRVRRWR